MIILVTYKLTPGRDYSGLQKAIQSAPATSWWHYIDNTWLLNTTETPAELNARLTPFLNTGSDVLLSIKVDPDMYRGWLPKKAHNWIKNQGSEQTHKKSD